MKTDTDRLNEEASHWQLTTVERAALLRAAREKRDMLKIERDRLIERARHKDATADAAARVLDAEVSILQAGIKTLWRQSGCDPPVEDQS